MSGVLFSIAMLLALPAQAETLTLERAWQIAEENNPQLKSSRAALDAALGELADSRGLLWNNPQISAERRRKEIPQVSGPTQVNQDWSVGFAQTFEVAGQQGDRRAAAEQSLAATQQVIAETRRQVRVEVESRFIRVLSLQLRIQAKEATLNLIEDAAKAVGKRVAAGEDSRLDGNLARVEAERARNQVALLREQLVQARAEFAVLLQLPPNELPQVKGVLDPASVPYSLDDLLNSAAGRPVLRALEHREQAAKSRLDLERAARYPDVTVGLGTGREGSNDAREKIVGLSVALPLPLFRQNAGGIGRAITEFTQTQIEREATGRDVRAQVVTLWERYTSLKARVQRLNESVLPSLEENRRLSSISFRAGEIGLLQLLLVNRQVLDGQRDLLDARTELSLTKVALEAAAGWQSTPDLR
ncbi:TolC family protein [Sulfuriferula sp. GW1]|uniref:TolC family protein n=1 Tax=Sulfuriferula sp. GW1 TaxID=3345111 RepID=UPI0039B0416A